MADDVILATEGLTKEFKGFTAVDGVALKVTSGTIHALIGPNGAGKTTCFNLLTKFLEPTRGSIVYKGRDITATKPADIARLPAPVGARERAHRAAAPARRLVRLLALREGAALARPRGSRADRGGRPCRLRRARGGRALLRPQARARDRDDARPRPGDAAPRRAHGRHGPRGHRPHRGADQARLGEAHHPHGRAQPVGRRLAVGPHHGAGPRPGAGRGRLRHGVEGPAGDRGLYRIGTWLRRRSRHAPRARARPRRSSRCAAFRPGTANRMSCTASTSTSRRARW